MTSALDLLMDSDSAAETTTLLESNGICTIDSRTRTIFVPPEIVVGAVQSDKNAERIKFSCPKIVGDNLDLSKFSIRINFENVSSVDPDISIKDQYICEDASINEDNITFSWVIGKNAARYMGTIRFIVCAVKTDSNSNISIEWNTTVAQIPVLEGIEIDQPSLDENNKDVINQLLAITKTASDEAVKNVNSAKEQAITDIQNVSQPDKTLTVEGGIADAKAAGNAISSLSEDLNNYAKSDFRYIPTTENNKFCRWDTGIIQPLDGKSVSSRIPVTEFENVEIYSNNDIYAICFFNGETFISGSDGSSPRPKSFSIPANCDNVIISFDGLDTNIVLVYISKIADYIVNTQVLPTYEFSVKTTKGFMRWDNGKVFIIDDYMMTRPFIVEPGREYYVDGAVTIAACFLNGSTFVSGTALNGIDHFTIPEGCNRCVVDFNIITNLPNILIRDPMIVNKSPCYGKSLGCLGDSITQGVGNNNHSWVDAMKGMCGFKSVYNYGVSGNTIEQMYDRIDAMESKLDYITLFGGTNNALWSNSQSISDFKSAFDSLVSSIIEKYPTSKVLGIIPPKYNYSSGDVTRNWNVSTSPNNLKLIDFVNAEIEIYSKYSVPIVNLFSCCNIQPDINAQKINLMPDGVHFNAKGYFDFVAPKIAEALNSI